jgi:transposase
VLTPEGVVLPPNTLAELQRDIARLRFIMEQIRQIEAARRVRLEQHPEHADHVMILLLARIIGVGIETADMLVHEILSRHLRDRKAVARYGGLTDAPDEGGARRREKGLARAGNAPVRHGMIQLAWRFFDVPEAERAGPVVPTADGNGRGSTRKTMIVALARKLLVALWRLVTTGEVPEGGFCVRQQRKLQLRRRRASEIGWPVEKKCDGVMPRTVRGGGDPRRAWLARRS